MYDYQTIRLLHRHGPDDWVPMEPGSHANAAEGDPERGWEHGRVLRCSRCDQEILVVDPAVADDPHPQGG